MPGWLSFDSQAFHLVSCCRNPTRDSPKGAALDKPPMRDSCHGSEEDDNGVGVGEQDEDDDEEKVEVAALNKGTELSVCPSWAKQERAQGASLGFTKPVNPMHLLAI